MKELLRLRQRALPRRLERRGFFVARQSNSNYCQTRLSLASTLNANYLDKLVSPGSSRPPAALGTDQGEPGPQDAPAPGLQVRDASRPASSRPTIPMRTAISRLDPAIAGVRSAPAGDDPGRRLALRGRDIDDRFRALRDRTLFLLDQSADGRQDEGADLHLRPHRAPRIPRSSSASTARTSALDESCRRPVSSSDRTTSVQHPRVCPRCLPQASRYTSPSQVEQTIDEDPRRVARASGDHPPVRPRLLAPLPPRRRRGHRPPRAVRHPQLHLHPRPESRGVSDDR